MNKLIKFVALIFVLTLVLAPVAVLAQDSSAPTEATQVVAPTNSLAPLYGIGCGLVLIGAGYGIGRIGATSVESMARQPEVAGKINTAMIVSAALIEGVTFFALIVCMLK